MGGERDTRCATCATYARQHFPARRPGSRSVKLPGVPGSIEFMDAYQAALVTIAPPPPSSRHVIRGSLADVTTGYFRSAAFANLASSSQEHYRTVLRPIVAAHGHRLVRELPKTAARNIVEAIGATRPGMANLTRAALSQVMVYAIATGVRIDDPFSGLPRYRLGTHHTWTDAELAQFERHWRLGTRERLAYALLLYTGQRGGDVVKMTRNDIVNGYIRVSQDKARKGTTNELLIPIHPALARALKAGPVVGMQHLIANARGQALTGLTDLIERAAQLAGLPPRCKAHGLRKAALRRLAEHGSTTKEIAAVSGHRSLSEIERYTSRADQARLATSAVAKLPDENKT